MKKLRTLTLILFAVLATAILGACSCKKESTIKVHTITAQVEATEGVFIVDDTHIQVVEGAEFVLTYVIKPTEASNTKVTFSSRNSNIVRVNPNSTSATGATGTGRFIAQSYNPEYYITTISVTTDDGGYHYDIEVQVAPNPSAISSVSGLTYSFENNRVEWNAVAGAVGYAVKIGDTNYYTTNNYYTGTEQGQLPLQEGEQYNISVLAKGDGVHTKDAENYSNAILVNMLEAPAVSSVNNGLIEWADVRYATSYNLYLYDDSQPITQGISTTSVDLKLYYDALNKTSRVFPVKLQAVSDNSSESVFYVPSGKSATLNITWLDKATNVRLNNYDSTQRQSQNSVILWDRVAGATGYKLNFNDEPITEKFYTVPASFEADEYELTIQSVGDPENTISDTTHSVATYTFKKLSEVSAVITNNTLSIDFSNLEADFGMNREDAKQFIYELYFTVENSIVKVIRLTSLDDLQYDLSSSTDIDSGSYEVYVKAVATNNMDFANGMFEQTPIKTGFGKLQYTNASKISKTGILDVNTISYMSTANNSKYIVTVDEIVVEIPTGSPKITIDGEHTYIDLNLDAVSMASLNAGLHTVRVVPKSDGYVNSTESLCRTFAFTKLSASNSYTMNNIESSVTWSNNESRNSGYTLTMNGSAVVRSNKYSNTYVVPTSALQDTNVFQVVALGNDVNYVNSDEYEFTVSRLNTVADIRVVDGQLSWDGADDVTYYINKYFTSGDRIDVVDNTTSTTYNNFSGSCGVTIYTSKAGSFNSVLSPRFQIDKLSSPTNIALNKNGATNTITFSGVEHASSYLMTISYASTEQVIPLSSSTTSYTLPQGAELAGADYRVVVVACGDENTAISPAGDTVAYITSNNSIQFNFTKLAKPTYTKLNGAVQWNVASTKTPASYELDFTGTSVATIPNQLINAVGNSGSFAFATYLDTNEDEQELPAGQYTFTITAHAKSGSAGANVIDSEPSESVVITKCGKVQPEINDGVISFNNFDQTIQFQYSTDGTFRPNQEYGKAGITLTTSASTTTVNINTAQVQSGYLRFVVIAGNGYASGSFGDSIYFEQIAPISQLRKSSTNLIWTSTTGATKYVIREVTSTPQEIKVIDDSSVLTTSIDNPTTVGVHTYDIYAIGSTLTYSQVSVPGTVLYINSNPTTCEVAVLHQVSNLRYANGMLSWDAYGINGVDHPDKLWVVIKDNDEIEYKKSLSATATSCPLDDAVNPLPENKAYTVSMYYEGTGSHTLDSTPVEYRNPTTSYPTIYKFTAPTPTVVDGTLQYHIVSSGTQSLSQASYVQIQRREKGTTDYVVLSQGTDYTVTIGTGGVNYITMNFPRTDVKYELQFKTVAPTDGLSSAYGDVFEVLKYSNVQNFRVEDQQFKWSINDLGQKYKITETSDATITVTTPNNSPSYPATGIVSGNGDYRFYIMALGTENYSGYDPEHPETRTAFINSEYSTAINVTYVGNVEDIFIADNVLRWTNITGIQYYQVEMRNSSEELKQTLRTADNSVQLARFFDDGDAYGTYVFSVKAITTIQDNYIITTTDVDNSARIYYSPMITDLHVENGEFAWSIDFGAFRDYYVAQGGDAQDITGDSAVQQFFNNLTQLKPTTDDYQKYKPFFTFTIEINGVETSLDPSTNVRYRTFTTTANSVTFYYTIAEDVTVYKNYTVRVRASGNSVAQDSEIPMILASNYSQPIRATKVPSPRDSRIEDGMLRFTLLTDATATDYVYNYILSASPITQGSAAPNDIIVGQSDLVIVGHEASYDLTPEGGDPWLSKNTTYSVNITSLGTLDSRTLSPGETIFLRSSNYIAREVIFFDDINTINYVYNDNKYGGYINWENKTGYNQEIYFADKDWYEQNALDEHGEQLPIEDWLDDGISCSKVRYFVSGSNSLNFTDDIKDINNVVIKDLVGEFYVGVRIQGDPTRGAIASKNIVFKNNLFTRLASTEFVSGASSWVYRGVFKWKEIPNVNTYKVVVEERGTVNKKYDPVYVLINQYELPDEVGTSGNTFSVYITPLGTQLDKRYLSGNTVQTYFYPLLTTPDPQFNTEENYMYWQSVANSDNYQVLLDGRRDMVSSAANELRYSLDTVDEIEEVVDGKHSVQVRAMSTVNNYLHGKFTEITTVVKLADPVLWAQKLDDADTSVYKYVRPGSVVMWKSANETLNSGLVQVKIYSSDSSGTQGTLVDEFIVNNSVRYYDISSPYIPRHVDGSVVGTGFDVGYYYITVKFINDEEDPTEVTLASSTKGMLIYKQNSPGLQFGTYYSPEDIDAGKRPAGLTFTRYIKWELVNHDVGYSYAYTEQNYTVKVEAVDEDKLYAWNSVSNPEMFQIVSVTDEHDVTTTWMCFDMSLVQESDVNVYVASMGEVLSATTAVEPDVIGNVSSNYSNAFNVRIPVSVPVVNMQTSDISKGIIKWTNEYNSDVEMLLEFDYYSYDGTFIEHKRYTELLKVEGSYIPNEYHLPFVANYTNVQLQYVQSGFASGYSDSIPNAAMQLFAGGRGTYSDPYIIFNDSADASVRNAFLIAQLRNMTYYPEANVYYVLRSDVDMTGTSWSMLDIDFAGTLTGRYFDGVDYQTSTISGISLNATALPNSNIMANALFRNITSTGHIDYLNLVFNHSHQESVGTEVLLRIGTLAYYNNGEITHVNISGTYALDYVGYTLRFAGLVYENNGTISDITDSMQASITIKGSLSAGGLVYTNNGTVENGVNSGIITINNTGQNATKLGGITYANNGTIDSCTVSGTLSGNTVGGITEYNEGTIEGCAFYGTLTVSEQDTFNIYVGGLVAENQEQGTIKASFVVLTQDTFTIYARAAGVGTSKFGGLVAYTAGELDIRNCYVSINYTMTGSLDEMCHLIGYADGGPITLTDVFYYESTLHIMDAYNTDTAVYVTPSNVDSFDENVNLVDPNSTKYINITLTDYEFVRDTTTTGPTKDCPYVVHKSA